MIVINGCRLFGRQKAGKFPHQVSLDEEHEKLLAAIMIHDHREATNAIERALEIQFSVYPTQKRSKLLADVAWRKNNTNK